MPSSLKTIDGYDRKSLGVELWLHHAPIGIRYKSKSLKAKKIIKRKSLGSSPNLSKYHNHKHTKTLTNVCIIPDQTNSVKIEIKVAKYFLGNEICNKY